MIRCSGGQNQRGEQRGGRIHMNGGEQDCAKHRSDNFSELSTTSRVAARNVQQALPVHYPQEDREDGEDAETAPVPSTASVIPESLIVPRSPDSTSAVSTSAIPSTPSRSSTGDNAVLPPQDRYAPYRPAAPHLIAAGLEQAAIADRRAGEPIRPKQSRNKTDPSFIQRILLLLAVGLYACYRWIFRKDFQYQDEIIRGHLDLPKRG